MVDKRDPLAQAFDDSTAQAQKMRATVSGPTGVHDYVDQLYSGTADSIKGADQESFLTTWGAAAFQLPGGQYFNDPLLIQDDIEEGVFLEKEMRGVRKWLGFVGEDPRNAILEGYNPLDDPAFENMAPEDKWKILDSTDQVAANRARYDLEQERVTRDVLDRAGFWENLAAGAASLPLDFTTWVEILVTKGLMSTKTAGSLAARAGASRGGNFALGAAAGGAAGGLQQSALEIGLGDRLLLRTEAEARAELIGSVLLGSVLGGGVGLLSEAVQRHASSEIMGTVAEKRDEIVADAASRLGPDATDAEWADALQAAIDDKGSDLLKARGLSRVPLLRRLSPDVRALNSLHKARQAHAQTISGSVLVSGAAENNQLTRAGLDSVKARIQGEMGAVVYQSRQILAQHGGTINGKKMSLPRFNQLVGEVLSVGDTVTPAMRTGGSVFAGMDDAAVQAVNDAAKVYRESFNEVSALAQKTGAFEEWAGRSTLTATNNGVPTWVTRLYDRPKAKADELSLRKLLQDWADEEGHVFSDVDMDKTLNHITNAPNGGGMADGAATNPLMQRVLEIPDDFATEIDGEIVRFSDFLIKDVEVINDHLQQRVVPQLLLADRLQGSRARRTMQLKDRAEDVRARVEALDETDPQKFERALKDTNDLSDAVHDAAVIRGLENDFRNPSTIKDRVEEYKELARFRRELNADIARAVRRVNKLELTGAEDDAILAAKQALGDLENQRRMVVAEIQPLEKDATSRIKENTDVGDVDLTVQAPKLGNAASQEEMLEFHEQLRDRITAERRAEFGEASGLSKWEQQIAAENQELVNNAKSVAEKKRLAKRLDRDILDTRATHRRFTGIPPLGQEAVTAITHGSSFLRLWNTLTSMGGVVVSSLPDSINGVLTAGMTNWTQSAAQHLRRPLENFSAKKFNKGSIESAIYGLEVMNSTSRLEHLAGVANPYAVTSSQKASEKLRKGFNRISGMGWWNSRMKGFAATQVQNGMVKAVRKMAEGGRIPAADRKFLQSMGISDTMAKRINKQLTAHAEQDSLGGKRVYDWARVDKWDDYEAVKTWKDAVFQGANNMVVTPGSGDLSLIFDSAVGALVLQFKSFAVASAQRITMAGLSAPDARLAQYLLFSQAAGLATHVLKSNLANQEVKWDDPAGLAINALDQSGAAALFMEANAFTEAATMGHAGLSPLLGSEQPLRRFSSRSLADRVAGPAVGRIEGLGRLAQLPFKDNVTEADASNVRRQLPYQNTIPARLLFDKLGAPLLFGEDADGRFERNLVD